SARDRQRDGCTSQRGPGVAVLKRAPRLRKGTNMHPIIEMTVDGQPVAGAFYERLVSLTVTDKEGVSSDTFSAELNDGPPNFLALPRTGAIVEIRLGYREAGVSSVGTFTVDKVEAKCLPYGVTISGKAADLRNSKLKETQERHWDNKTLGDIVK